MVKTNIQSFPGEVEILSNLHVGSYLTANGAASNVLEITGNVGATFFIGDGGFLSNIATTLNDITNQGNVISNVVTFEANTNYGGVGLVTSSNVGIQNTNPLHTLSVGDKVIFDDNTVESSGQSVIRVDGRINATRFEGDGGLLSNIATTLSSIVNQGNTASNVVIFNAADEFDSGGVGLVTNSNVGIQNTSPTFNLSVGSNLHVDDTGANVLTVHGNVTASNLNLGVFSITPAYGLNDVCSTSNGTSNVVQFQNSNTSIVTTSNINVGGQVIITGATKGLDVTSNIELGGRLKFDSNVFIDTLRVADVATNLVTYDQSTGELLDSGGTFLNKFAVVSEQPPSDLFANTTTVTNHGGYTLTTSNLATNSNTYNAFDGTANTWTGGTGMYVGGSNVLIETNLTQLSNLHPTQFGDWLAIEFPYKTTLRHMKLTPATVWQSFPYAANLYATNNDLTWTEIKYWDGLNPGSASNVQTITVNATEQFKKYALVTTKLVPNTNIASAVALQDWQLFTESFSIDGGKVEMATSAVMGGETTVDQHGPHSRDPKAVPLKKYPEIVFDASKMDGNDSTNTYIQAGYTVTASSQANLSTFRPWNTFDGNIGNEGWHAGSGDSWTGVVGGTASYNGVNSLGSISGGWLKLELPHKIRLSYIDLLPRDYTDQQEPKDFKILGSNDDTNWVELIDVVGATWTQGVYRKFSVTGEVQAYKYLAILVSRVTSPGPVIISDLKYYGYEEDPPAGDTSVDTTFTSIMNTPQTTGANVYVDAKLSSDFTNRVVGPTVSNTHTTYVSAGKYWELSGNVESNVTLEANTFLSGDAPHSLSMWFNSSNLVSNASNSCIFSLGTEERLDHISAAFSNNYQTVQKFTAGSRSTTLANFGQSCAINSDGTRMIVGALNEDNGGTNYGAVYIYTYSDGKWDNGVRIGAPTPVSGTADQGFGRDVDINSAGTRVVVGSWFDDTGAGDAGAAWVYSYSNGNWTLDTVSGVSTGRIQASNAGAGDRFGNSVAMSGDGTRITVGAILEDDAGVTNAGSAYIYTYSGGSWGSEKIIRASDVSTGGNAEFGWKVAMNNDGTKVVVGAAFHDTGGGDIGAAYVFTYNSSGDSWSQQEKIQSSDKVAGDRFGYSVDINSDGTKIVVGADSHGSGAGAAYIYTYSNGSWYDSGNNEQKIQASDKQANSQFGGSIAFNTDGTKLIVGAYHEDTGAGDSGAAYIFAYDGSNWNEVVKLKAYDAAGDDEFGFSVAMNGDGTRVVVGADGDDESPGASSGSVYVYDRDTTHHLTTDLKLQSNTWHNLTYAYQGEGGSRVTYLDGRKVAEDQAEDTFGDYPPFAMTGYSQGGYVVSFSDRNASSNWKPFYAFNDDITSTYTGYITDDNYTTADPGPYNGTDANALLGTRADTGANIVDGSWLKIEMPHKLVADYLQIYARTDEPDSFKLYGSNDDLVWTELLSVTGNTTLNAYLNYPTTIKGAFKYFAMTILKNGSAQPYTRVDIMRIYGHRENDLVRLPDPTNVLKYPHIAMSGPAQRGYVVTESSYAQYNANLGFGWRAFDSTRSSSSSEFSWQTDSSTYPSSGNARTGVAVETITENSNTHVGSWVTLETPHKIQVSSVELTCPVGIDQYRPNSIVILGSDNNSTWNFLTGDISSTYTNDIRTITITSSVAYKYHMLLVKTTGSVSAGYATTTFLSDIRYYGTEENSSIPIQIGGGNIDKVANFRVYDKFIGEDQALEIWDAQKDEFGRAKSSMTLQKGRLGIGTDEPQGRLAVADEPHAPEKEFPPRAGGFDGDEWYIEGHGTFKASASNYHDSKDYYPGRAFTKSLVQNFGYATDSSSTLARWSGNNGLPNQSSSDPVGTFQGHQGDWLELELPYRIRVKSFQIQTRFYSGSPGDHPKNGFLYGSNNRENWTQITEFTNLSYTPSQLDGIGAHKAAWNINSETGFKYLRLLTTQKIDGSDSWLMISELKYFGTREQGQSVLHDGQLTLTKSLTVPRIGPALDADDTPRRDRLVVEYNTSTNPTFEGAVRDTSGRGNDGVFRGSASYDATQKSLEFPSNPVTGSTSGTYDSIFAGDIFKRKITQHTVSLWLKPNSMGAWEQVYGIGQNASAKNEGLWISGTDTLAVHTEGSNPSQQYHYTIGNVNGQWIHVTHVRNSLTFNDHILYVNGIPLTATTTAGGTGTMSIPEESDLRIGGRIMGNDNYWLDGSISNFKLYDTVLTAEEVKTLYDMGRCDEGHHVVNFSKTRVGIGLGDGEAPSAALDVRGDIMGGCPVYFQALYNANLQAARYDVAPYGTLVPWNTLFEHKGDCFDTSTGLFTAPIDGLYSFGYSMRKQTGAYGDFWTYVQKNGSPLSGTNNSPGRLYVDGGSSGASVFASQTFILDLSAGDTVGVIIATANGIDARISNSYNYFHGYYVGRGNGSFGSYSY